MTTTCTVTPNPVSVTAPENDFVARRRKVKLPADPAMLARYSRWHLESGRALIGLVLARTTLEMYVRALAVQTQGQVSRRGRNPARIAYRLHAEGFLALPEASRVAFLHRSLSQAAHYSECRYEPAYIIETLEKFIADTKDRITSGQRTGEEVAA